MKKFSLRIVLLLVLFVLILNGQMSAQLVGSVKTENGLVSGVTNGEIVLFKGIPFAAPPVGDLRWKAPQPAQNWEGILKCTEFSASPMQATPVPFMMWTQEFIAPKEPLSEDCLYLNVWTGAKTDAEKRPVFVYIYGGGFSSGSSACAVYDGEEMAKKGVVFVSINYRVGVLGFLAHPELTAESGYNASGNYGLLDQVEALKWVKKNIANFGGDPNNVTIAGQSAGAFSVNYLVASPLTKGLIHRAIAESGGAVLPTNQLANGNALKSAEESGVKWAKTLGANSIAELRAKPANEIITQRASASPIVDGYLIPDQMYKIFAEGKQNDIPLILGWNADEGNFGGPPQNAETFIKQSQEKFGDKTSEFLKYFPAGNDKEAIATQTQLSALQIFGLQSYKWMLYQNKTGKSNVFMYNFQRAVPHGEGMKPYGAFHTGEVPYAYNNLKMSPRPWEEVDYQLADVMSSYWVNFAKTGNPNGEGLPEWDECSPSNQKAIILGGKVILKDLPNAKGLKFLEVFYTTNLIK